MGTKDGGPFRTIDISCEHVSFIINNQGSQLKEWLSHRQLTLLATVSVSYLFFLSIYPLSFEGFLKNTATALITF